MICHGWALHQEGARRAGEALASASIGQVHRATHADGSRIVLKIRRPGIRATVEADLRILTRLAELAEERIPELRRYRPRALVRQFSRTLRDELDLRIEARNAARLRANLREDESVVLPRMYDEYTRERLCVMECFEGASVGAWAKDPERSLERGREAAAIGAATVLRMVFEDGCFHADPHPGNLFLLEDGRVGLIDFGMIGYLAPRRRAELVDLLVAVTQRDVEAAVDLLLDWSEGRADPDELMLDVTAFLDRYYGLTIAELDTTELLGDLTSMARRNDLYLPPDVALLLKVFVTLDGVGKVLDPEFVMARHMEPFARAIWRRERSPVAVLRSGTRDLAALLGQLPRDLRRFAASARRGDARLGLELDELEDFGRRIDQSANRITVGLITAALIVGTSISLTARGDGAVLGLPTLGLLGFLTSVFTGLWIVWSILRSGRS